MTYAIGLALLQLLCVSSPNAFNFLPSPSSSTHLGSDLMRSTARLKWVVLLSVEKTSEYKT